MEQPSNLGLRQSKLEKKNKSISNKKDLDQSNSLVTNDMTTTHGSPDQHSEGGRSQDHSETEGSHTSNDGNIDERIEPTGILRINYPKLKRKIADLCVLGHVQQKFIKEIRLLISVESFFSPNFIVYKMYPWLRNILHSRDISTNHSKHAVTSPEAIRIAQTIWPEQSSDFDRLYKLGVRGYEAILWSRKMMMDDEEAERKAAEARRKAELQELKTQSEHEALMSQELARRSLNREEQVKLARMQLRSAGPVTPAEAKGLVSSREIRKRERERKLADIGNPFAVRRDIAENDQTRKTYVLDQDDEDEEEFNNKYAKITNADILSSDGERSDTSNDFRDAEPRGRVRELPDEEITKQLAPAPQPFQAEVPIPTGSTGINIKTHIVPINVPFLVVLDVLIENGIKLDFETHQMVGAEGKWSVPMHYVSGHVYIRPKSVINRCNFTMSQLKKMHYHFMHPSSGKLFNLIKKGYPAKANQSVNNMLEKISRACEVCNEHSIPPFRFRASIPEGNITFNREIAIDIMWLSGKPALHIVDTETNFQNAVFISGKQANAYGTTSWTVGLQYTQDSQTQSG